MVQRQIRTMTAAVAHTLIIYELYELRADMMAVAFCVSSWCWVSGLYLLLWQLFNFFLHLQQK